MVNDNMQITSRILRDMDEGILVLDKAGTILYLNSIGCELLGAKHDPVGKKYAAVFLNSDARNDTFHQLVLDAVYDKEKSQIGVVDWIENNEKRKLKLTTSFLQSEENDEKTGVVVLISDVTEVEKLHCQRRESSVIFAAMMMCVSSYLFFFSAMQLFQWEIPLWVTSIIIQLIALAMFIVVKKRTSISFRDMGIILVNAKQTFFTDILITLAGVVLLVGAKVILLWKAPGFFPKDVPFWDWSIGNVSDIYYPITVIIQEFLSRGVMQESLQRIFTGKHGTGLAVLVSSFAFGLFHIAYGFPYMVGATVLLGALGILYNKQKNIWGLCIIHYVLGEVAIFLRYVV